MDYLSNPYVLSLLGGTISVAGLYLDAKSKNKTYQKQEYLKLFLLTSILMIMGSIMVSKSCQQKAIQSGGKVVSAFEDLSERVIKTGVPDF